MQGCWFNGLTQLRSLALHTFGKADGIAELHFNEFPPQLCDISVDGLDMALSAIPCGCTEMTVLRINTDFLNVLGIVPGNATLGANLELHLSAANMVLPSSPEENFDNFNLLAAHSLLVWVHSCHALVITLSSSTRDGTFSIQLEGGFALVLFRSCDSLFEACEELSVRPDIAMLHMTVSIVSLDDGVALRFKKSC